MEMDRQTNQRDKMIPGQHLTFILWWEYKRKKTKCPNVDTITANVKIYFSAKRRNYIALHL